MKDINIIEEYQKLPKQEKYDVLKGLIKLHREDITHIYTKCDICSIDLMIHEYAEQCSFCGNIYDCGQAGGDWCSTCDIVTCGCVTLVEKNNGTCQYCDNYCSFCDKLISKESAEKDEKIVTICDCGIVSCGCFDMKLDNRNCKFCKIQGKNDSSDSDAEQDSDEEEED